MQHAFLNDVVMLFFATCMLAGVNMAPFLMKFRHRPLSFPHFCVLPIVGTMPLSFLCQLNEVALKDTTAAAYVDESGNLALVNPGEGEIVSKEVGEEERGTGGCVDRDCGRAGPRLT